MNSEERKVRGTLQESFLLLFRTQELGRNNYLSQEWSQSENHIFSKCNIVRSCSIKENFRLTSFVKLSFEQMLNISSVFLLSHQLSWGETIQCALKYIDYYMSISCFKYPPNVIGAGLPLHIFKFNLPVLTTNPSWTSTIGKKY